MSVAQLLPYGVVGLLFAAVALRGGVTAGTGSALGLGVAVLALFAAGTRELRAAPRDALGVAVLWGGLALAQVGWSESVDAALDGAAAVLAVATIFLLAVTAVPDAERRRVLVIFTALGAAVALVAIAAASPGIRASFPLGNPNHLAGWLLLPGAIAFAGMFFSDPSSTRKWLLVLWFGAVGLVAAGIAAAGSRGAAIAGALVAAALATLGHWRGRWCVRALAGALVAAALALAVSPGLWPELIPAAIAGGERSVGIRWQVYGAAARSAVDAAPTGVGLGGFAAAFAANRPATLPYAPRFAHSEFLHGAVELGVPFLVAVGVTLALVVRRAALRRDGRRSLAAWGGGAAVLAVVAHALVDFSLHIPAIAIGAAALGGLAWRAAANEFASGRRATRLALASLAAALASLAGTQALAVRAAARAEALLVAGDFAGAASAAREGLRVRPARAELLRLVAEAAEHEHALGGGGGPALQQALAARQAAAAASARRADLQVEWARTLARAGSRTEALAAIDRAIGLDPVAPGPHLARARILLEAARPREAAFAVRAAVRRHPVSAFGAVEALLRATGDPALAGVAVPEIPRAIAGAGRALARAGYSREAGEQFERALALEPADPKLAMEAARSLRAAGEPDRAAAVLVQTLQHVPHHARLLAELERLGAAPPSSDAKGKDLHLAPGQRERGDSSGPPDRPIDRRAALSGPAESG